MTDKEFDEFVDRCYEELEDKQEKLFNTYNIGLYDSYWFDQTSSTLQFKNNDEVLLEFKVICVGTWAQESNTWMWSWANESFTIEIRKDGEVLKGLKEFTGYGVFEKQGFECDESMAYEVVAMAVNYLNALGMYKIPGGKSDLFVALIESK